MPFELIEAAIDTRLNRLGVDRIDLLQFHWWDYDNKQYIEAMKNMKILKERVDFFLAPTQHSDCFGLGENS